MSDWLPLIFTGLMGFAILAYVVLAATTWAWAC